MTEETELTYLQQKVKGTFEWSGRTRKSALLMAAIILGSGVVCAILSVFAFNCASCVDVSYAVGMAYCVAILAALAAVVAVIYAPIAMIVALVRPTKTVTCPGCGHGLSVFRSVDSTPCPGCHHMLHFGKGENEPLSKVPCPYCTHEIYVEKDHGNMTCADCGLGIVVEGTDARLAGDEETTCAACEERIPRDAIFCVHCEAPARREGVDISKLVDQVGVEKALDDVGKDSEEKVKEEEPLFRRAAKGPRGHYYHALTALGDVEELAGKEDEFDVSDPYRRVTVLFNGITIACEGFEEALAVRDFDERIAEHLDRLDGIYAGVLEGFHATIEKAQEKYVQDVDVEDQYNLLKGKSFVLVHNAVVQKLGDRAPGLARGKQWSETIYGVNIEESGGLMRRKYGVIIGWDEMKKEARKLRGTS